MNCKPLLIVAAIACFTACKKHDIPPFVNEDPSSFAEIGSIDIGDAGAAEITAYDPKTKRLFVVNNGTTNKIDVIDFSNPSAMKLIHSISIASYGGFVNSLDVSNGKLAAAIEASDKQQPGKVVIFETADYKEVKVIPVGALPDMVTYTPDGCYILSANEGEPNSDYTNDPLGTVSLISVKQNYAVTTLDFSAFTKSYASLQAKGLRVFGLNASFAQDMEPEYIAVSDDSKTAWVTLQENNAIAKIDITGKTITEILPLGFKDYSTEMNAIDASDKDDEIAFKKWNVYGMYQPDAIAFLNYGGSPYLFTANEGDVREYDGFAENERVKNMVLDPTAFPNAPALQKDKSLGRLNITTTLGETDIDGDFDALYSFGARSFSVWNGNSGVQVFDSKNELDKKTSAANFYDDGRSDDKSIEPEGITIGKVGHKQVAFIGMERADAVALYDVSNPANPTFLQLLKCGDAPEGILFIKPSDSPVKTSLLVVSSEGDGVIKVYQPQN